MHPNHSNQHVRFKCFATAFDQGTQDALVVNEAKDCIARKKVSTYSTTASIFRKLICASPLCRRCSNQEQAETCSTKYLMSRSQQLVHLGSPLVLLFTDSLTARASKRNLIHHLGGVFKRRSQSKSWHWSMGLCVEEFNESSSYFTRR